MVKDNKNLEINLKYQFALQKIHASLTMLTLGIIAFVSTFIWYLERLLFGITLSLIIILISLIFYQKTKRDMDELIEQLTNQ